ncbi:MAG TPA: hypothetical protein VFU32_11820, partial [Ktedonobacterales bacterium]|nr:hypothetical protein [Ktedonobacterales bacterium]
GLLSGAITMMLLWVGQTIYGLVSAAQSPAGVLLNTFLQTTILHGIAYFVFGGLFGWYGARSAARRSRSILSPSSSQVLSSPGTTLSIVSAGASAPSIPAQDTTPELASGSAQHEAPPSTLEGHSVFDAVTTDEQEGTQS